MPGTRRLSRRSFLKTSFAAAAGFTIVPRRVLGGPGYLPPSDELTKAVIGVGEMGLGPRGLRRRRPRLPRFPRHSGQA
jgi:myo-inositol 2-dehydrogenase/D-chiro-inositol 1-dehydrogenase